MANLRDRAQALAADMEQQAQDKKDRAVSERSIVASEYVARILGETVDPSLWAEAEADDVRTLWGVADGPALGATVGEVPLLYVQGTSGGREPKAIPSLWVRTVAGVEKVDEIADLAKAVEKGLKQ